MSLRLKFNLVLAAVLLVAAAGAGVYVPRFLQQSAIEEVQHTSQIMMHAAMAIRDYTTELVKPHLDVTLAEKFLPQTVPAYAATETLRRLQNRFPGYEYKEAVLNPTNLRDRANEWEERIISDFREGRADLKTEVTGEVGDGPDPPPAGNPGHKGLPDALGQPPPLLLEAGDQDGRHSHQEGQSVGGD